MKLPWKIDFFSFSSCLKDGFLSSKYYRELHKYKISNQLILPQFVLKILEFLILVEGWIVVVRRVSWIHATTTSWNWISCWNPCHWVAWFSTWNPISRSCGGMNRIFPFFWFASRLAVGTVVFCLFIYLPTWNAGWAIRSESLRLVFVEFSWRAWCSLWNTSTSITRAVAEVIKW